MALILSGAERQLIELLRSSEPDKFHLAIHRSSVDEWEIEMSFEIRNHDGRSTQRIDKGVGPSFAKAWEDMVSID